MITLGVIIGDDLVCRVWRSPNRPYPRSENGQLPKWPEKMLKEKPEEAEQLADEIIRNTYRTLMTRGQKGCFIYCTDKELEG
ncbi:MAG: DNA/RNA helicase domain-containing protein [Bacillota bacterium]